MPERIRFEHGAATTRRFGVLRAAARGEHDVTVTGDAVPTVHLDDVLLGGVGNETRPLHRPGRIEVDGQVGTIRQRSRLGLTRAGRAVHVEVGGYAWVLRRRGLLRKPLVRIGFGVVAHQRLADLYLHDRADAVDAAVAAALWRGIDNDAVSVLPGG